MTNYYGSNGAGKGFADADAVAAEIGTAAVGNSPATGLMKALADGRTLEAAETAYFTTGAGKDYSNSADISGTISDLQTLLDSNDSNNEADTVTGFFDTHNGVGNARDIDDLADLNGQIANSIVTRNIGVSNATPQTVKLTTAEVDRLGEGAVQVEVTQTDKVGNLHAGDAATKSFVIDTIVPEVVSITDNQSGIAFDGADTVAYTLTFSENLQEIDANDLNVTGANIVSVVHSAGSKTATVNVKVDQDSVSDVVITAKPSILDIAGNPLVQAVNDSQDVDTRNPTASYASEIKNQNTNGTADVSSDADSVVAYTVTFSEPVAGITPTDIDIAGGALVANTLDLIEGGRKATFDVQATDDSVANLVVKVKDTVKDLNGNTLVESSSAAVTVDTQESGRHD